MSTIGEELVVEPISVRVPILGILQQQMMGVKVLQDMLGHNREKGIEGGSKIAVEKHGLLCRQAKACVEVDDIEF